MTQDEIIRMARNSGMSRAFVCASPDNCPDDDNCCHYRKPKGYWVQDENLERFAALVAAHWQKIHQQEMSMMSELCADRILEEREACAKVCEEIDNNMEASWKRNAVNCAAAIRARGES